MFINECETTFKHQKSTVTHCYWINVLRWVFNIKRKIKKWHHFQQSSHRCCATDTSWHRGCCPTCKVKVWKKINFCFAISAWWNRQQEEWKDWNVLNEKRKKKQWEKFWAKKENGGTIRWHRKKRIGKKRPKWHQKPAQAAEAGTQINNEYADRKWSGPHADGGRNKRARANTSQRELSDSAVGAQCLGNFKRRLL